jgi:hypothetical protein
MKEKIIASMATMPGRERSLKLVIDSIINQVDMLYIYANEIKEVYPFLNHPRIRVFLSDDHEGDLGDAGKFYNCHKYQGYHFTIDDDIIYPKDYVGKTIASIDQYCRQFIVSYHGRIFKKLPVYSYYHGHTESFGFFKELRKDTFAHIIGTGVMAYHTDTIRFNTDIFKAKNMADIWLSKYCEEMNISRIILKHPSDWIRQSHRINNDSTIYRKNHDKDSLQVEILNSVDWSLPPFVL